MLNEYINYLYNYDAQASGLLGNFDSQNNYKIQDDLKEALLKANKLITDFKEDLITCNALIGAYKFEFRVLIQEGQGHQKRVGLFLIEKASQGFYEQELQTLIHYIIIPNDGAFIETVKKTFHLFTRDESEGVDMANEMLQAILKRKKELEAMQYNSILMLEHIDSEYVKKMLSILKGYGLIGDRLIIDFKNMVKAKSLSKMETKYWKELKTILDKLIISNMTVFDSSVISQMQTIQQKYLSSQKAIKIPKIIEVVNTSGKSQKKGGASKTKASESAEWKMPEWQKQLSSGSGGNKDKGKSQSKDSKDKNSKGKESQGKNIGPNTQNKQPANVTVNIGGAMNVHGNSQSEGAKNPHDKEKDKLGKKYSGAGISGRDMGCDINKEMQNITEFNIDSRLTSSGQDKGKNELESNKSNLQKDDVGREI